MKIRRSVGRALTEMHYRLRTEGSHPVRRAIALGLGAWIGALPLYGLHLLICVVVARLLGLSRVLTYFAAHLNNPLTAPVLLWVEFSVGHALRRGRWPALSLAEARTLTLWTFGSDLLVGSLVVGGILALVFASLGYLAAARGRAASFRGQVIEETSRRYADFGICHWEFVRGKLRHDPLYDHALSPGVLPTKGRLLDLGCGRGILLAALRTARRLERESAGGGSPAELELVGIECDRRIAAIARRALGGEARIRALDLSDYEPEPCTAAIMFDVLHYLGPDQQLRLLSRLCAALRPGGVLLIREPDDRPRWRFRLTRLQERLSAWSRRRRAVAFHFRGAAEWRSILEGHGLEVEVSPLSRGTPFSNVLIQGFRR